MYATALPELRRAIDADHPAMPLCPQAGVITIKPTADRMAAATVMTVHALILPSAK
jgi:hypothetical protein